MSTSRVRPAVSEYTATDTEMRATLQDPALDSFKGFSAVNGIFAAGRVLHFIFTGRKNAGDANNPLRARHPPLHRHATSPPLPDGHAADH